MDYEFRLEECQADPDLPDTLGHPSPIPDSMTCKPRAGKGPHVEGHSDSRRMAKAACTWHQVRRPAAGDGEPRRPAAFPQETIRLHRCAAVNPIHPSALCHVAPQTLLPRGAGLRARTIPKVPPRQTAHPLIVPPPPPR